MKSDKGELRVSLFDGPAWRFFIRFYRGQYRLILLSAIGSAAQSLLVLPSLILIRNAFDVAIPQGDAFGLVLIGLGVFALRVANSGVSLSLRAVNIQVIRAAILKMREELLTKLYQVSRTFYTQVDRNTVHAQIVQDTARLDDMGNALVSRLLPALFTSLALCCVMLFLNWYLVLIMVSLFPVIFLANRLTGKIVKKRVYVFQRAFESFSKGVMFVLTNMDLTRIQSAEQEEIKRQKHNLENLRGTSARMAFIYAVHSQLQQTLTGLSAVIILIFGGAAVGAGSMTLGEFLSFYVAAGLLNGYVSTMTASVPEIIAGNESIVTLHRLAQANDVRPYRGEKRIEFKGTVTLETVSFAYKDDSVLNDINFTIRPDSNVAVIGANGSGKTTLILLILGFYRPVRGLLYADGIPYEEIDIPYLRRSIGVVMQHPTLFSGSILENICYGSTKNDRKDVIRASKAALADEFIERLPHSYDTQIGQDGVLLSGGECQRIVIARALLRRPRLLILDEPTNHLDKVAVHQLMTSLNRIDDRPAILTISHDMNVLSRFAQIYQLENGTLTQHSNVSAVR